jgi:hypothetical protein
MGAEHLDTSARMVPGVPGAMLLGSMITTTLWVGVHAAMPVAKDTGNANVNVSSLRETNHEVSR